MSTLSYVSNYRAILRHGNADRSDIIAFRDWQVRRLVAHAYEHVPYWRRLLDAAGVHPRHVRTADDLPLLPITTKQDLRALPLHDIVARGVDPERLLVRTTSGSTGQPFSIRRTRPEEVLYLAFLLRAKRDYPLHRSDHVVRINKRPSRPPYRSLALRMLGASSLTQICCLAPPEEILSQLCEIRPEVIGSYPGVLARVAHLVGEKERRLFRTRLILTGAEVLTPAMRQQITEAFGAPVYDLYGCHELRNMGRECPKTGAYHIPDDGVFIEVLKPDGSPAEPGERGEVVGTNLHSFAMPFIRYRVGDVVTRGEERCACGQPFSTLRNIQGRMNDYFPLPDGRLLHPFEFLTPIRGDAPWVGTHQLVQERVDRFVLRVVPLTPPSSKQVATVRGRVAAALGVGVELELHIVPELQLEESGKFRMFRSLVHSTYDGIDWNRTEVQA